MGEENKGMWGFLCEDERDDFEDLAGLGEGIKTSKIMAEQRRKKKESLHQFKGWIQCVLYILLKVYENGKGSSLGFLYEPW